MMTDAKATGRRELTGWQYEPLGKGDWTAPIPRRGAMMTGGPGE